VGAGSRARRLTVCTAAGSGTSSTAPHSGHQRGQDRGGEENTDDPAMASLTGAGVFDHASSDVGPQCGRRGRRLNDHRNVLV
jgi:hypothetical protein